MSRISARSVDIVEGRAAEKIMLILVLGMAGASHVGEK